MLLIQNIKRNKTYYNNSSRVQTQVYPQDIKFLNFEKTG